MAKGGSCSNSEFREEPSGERQGKQRRAQAEPECRVPIEAARSIIRRLSEHISCDKRGTRASEEYRCELLSLAHAAGLGGAALHWLIQPHAEAALVGASGSIAGLMAVSAVVHPV